MDDKKKFIDSKLSFWERLFYSTLEYEIKMGLVPKDFSPRKELFKLKELLKENLKEENLTAEEVINEYIRKLKYETGITLNKSLYEKKVNCCSSTGLHLALSEMLDFKLFEKYTVGHIYNPHLSLGGHIFLRRKSGRGFKNIDFGEEKKLYFYKKTFETIPENKPLEFLISCELSNCGALITDQDKNRAEVCIRKALKISPENFYAWNDLGGIFLEKERYEDALTCYMKSLEIQPNYFWGKVGLNLTLKKLEMQSHE